MDLVQDFLGDCRLRGMSPTTVVHYGYCLNSFCQYLDQRGSDILQVERDILRGYIDHLRREGKSSKTLENIFSVLSSFFDYLVYENWMDSNPVLPVRKRYLRNYKDNGDSHTRKLISVEEMARMIIATLDPRDQAILILLAKTGIRRNELITLDVSDVDLIENKIRLKPTAKRSNRTVFIDDEAAFILRKWLRIRKDMKTASPALFIGHRSGRLERHGIYDIVIEAAKRVGLHDPTSDRMEDHFSPHCCRHWFTTHLRRAGMAREFIQELRGDARREAIDIYDHIDEKELKEAYLACIPRLGI